MNGIHYIVVKVRGTRKWCVALYDAPGQPIEGTLNEDKKKCLKMAAARENMSLKEYMKARKETT